MNIMIRIMVGVTTIVVAHRINHYLDNRHEEDTSC